MKNNSPLLASRWEKTDRALRFSSLVTKSRPWPVIGRTIFFTSDKNRPTNQKPAITHRDEIYFIDFWRENLSLYRIKVILSPKKCFLPTHKLTLQGYIHSLIIFCHDRVLILYLANLFHIDINIFNIHPTPSPLSVILSLFGRLPVITTFILLVAFIGNVCSQKLHQNACRTCSTLDFSHLTNQIADCGVVVGAVIS